MAAACGGQAELVDSTSSDQPLARESADDVAARVRDANVANIPSFGSEDPVIVAPPDTPIGTREEEPPVEPPVTPPPPTEPPVTPPVADPPPPPPVVDAGTPMPPPDPNAGWTAIPQGTRRVTFPQGQTGPGTTGAANIYSIAGARRYRMKYEVMPEGANFDFRAGGKLPGFGGGSAPTGGSQAQDGYSARLMWNHGGRISFYFYRVTGGTGGIDTGGYGTHWMWAPDATLIPGQWNTIELLVDMDTGETVGYLNGVEKGRQTLSYQWSTTDKIVFSAFFGGQGASYEPSKNEAMSFRNLMIKSGG